MHGVEGVIDVCEGLLEAEGRQHDARHHREVQVRVRVPCEHVARAPFRRQGQASCVHERDDVEVRPPQGGGEADPEHRRRDHAGGEIDPGTDTQRDDRLAERQDDDQAVALGEVPRHQLPPSHAEQRRAAPVDQDRDPPQRLLGTAREERRAGQQPDSDGRADRQTDDRPA